MSAPVGRPSKGDRISMGLRIPRELHARLEQAAMERDVALNWLVTRAIEDFLPRLLPLDEILWTRREEEKP